MGTCLFEPDSQCSLIIVCNGLSSCPPPALPIVHLEIAEHVELHIRTFQKDGELSLREMIRRIDAITGTRV